jgi:hypothetical protein
MNPTQSLAIGSLRVSLSDSHSFKLHIFQLQKCLVFRGKGKQSACISYTQTQRLVISAGGLLLTGFVQQ